MNLELLLNNNLLSKAQQNDVWASYFVGKYYFVVDTGKERNDCGLKKDSEFTREVQRWLQFDNIVAIVHEYIHYIHEISTVVGNIWLGLDVKQKSLFSYNLVDILSSSLHNGIAKGDAIHLKYVKIFYTKEVINGAVIQNARILKVIDYTLMPMNIYIPYEDDFQIIDIDIPYIKVELYSEGKFKIEDLAFGRFLLYEGLAYELDRELDRHLDRRNEIDDKCKLSEYTVLRLLAQKIFPNSSRKLYLSLASLSLSYVNCGSVFISRLKKAKILIETGNSEEMVLDAFKIETSKLLKEKSEEFEHAQRELVDIFRKRERLHSAFLAIIGQSINTYRVRMENPCFEVEMIFSCDMPNLLKSVPICDYMYKFSDEEEFNRDIFGTATFEDNTSEALKVLIGYDHYQKSHIFNGQILATEQIEKLQHAKCPFYSCCNLEERISSQEICQTKPWRMFEILIKGTKGLCWYALAVAEFKGPTQI